MDRSRRWFLPALVGVVLAMAIGAWWGTRTAGAPHASAELPGSSGPTASPFGPARGDLVGTAGGPGAAASAAAAPDWMSAGTSARSRLPELSSEDWQALKDATQGQAHADAELARLASFTRFQKGFERWQSLREKADAAGERTELARELLQTLGAHLERQELMPGEALLVQAALLEDAEPDPARRQVALDRMKAEVERIVNQQREAQGPQEAKAYQQQQELERLQSEILRRCQSEPGGACDQKTLESQLDAARAKVYGP